MKKIALFFLVFFFYINLNGQIQANSQVQVFIDSQLQVYDQNPIIENGTTLVPLRGIFETLGAKVTWDDKTKTVTATRADTVINITINSRDALVNGKKVPLLQPAKIVNDRTLVPLRFISESLGAKVEWQEISKTVYIFTDKPTNAAVAVRGIQIGDTKEKVDRLYGQPKQTFQSQYGFSWAVYHQQYQDYLQVGIENGKVVALYTNNPIFTANQAIRLGTEQKDVPQRLGAPLTSIQKGNTIFRYSSEDEWDLYFLNNSYVTFFYDVHEGRKVTAIQVIEANVEKRLDNFYGVASEQLQRGFERQLFELTNAIRVQKGLSVLTWDEKVAQTARKHSIDMAMNKYFSHIDLKGHSPFDRMDADGISYIRAGENLAMGQMSSIFAHEGLLNSLGHRKNILEKEYKMLGVGVSFSGRIPYFTQLFFSTN